MDDYKLPDPLPRDHPAYRPHGHTVPGKAHGNWIAHIPDPDNAQVWQWVCLQCRSEFIWGPANPVGRPPRCQGLDWLAKRIAQMPLIKEFGPDDPTLS